MQSITERRRKSSVFVSNEGERESQLTRKRKHGVYITMSLECVCEHWKRAVIHEVNQCTRRSCRQSTWTSDNDRHCAVASVWARSATIDCPVCRWPVEQDTYRVQFDGLCLLSRSNSLFTRNYRTPESIMRNSRRIFWNQMSCVDDREVMINWHPHRFNGGAREREREALFARSKDFSTSVS